jgi:hypothetical protein
MPEATRPIAYTEVEIRSHLPSGWGIAAGTCGRWDARRGAWTLAVHDVAANVWTVAVSAGEAAQHGRLGALAAKIRELERTALGRKSVLTG